MNSTVRLTGAAAALASVVIGLVLVWPEGGASNNRAYAQQPVELSPADEAAIAGAQQLSVAFRAAAKRLRPSVVTIATLAEQQVRFNRRGSPFGGRGVPEEFRGLVPDEFFEDLAPRRERSDDFGEERSPQKVQTGVGSGVIVTTDGYILTNNHVVATADELQVELSDGRTYQAEVVGTDEKSDVAVLKIDARGLVPAALGDSATMEVGDWVIAVGSPFGLDQTVTAGIISARNRQTGIISGGYEDFLQTDAAINPGNSGGPLINLRGEVIGINTAINSRTGTNAGVGFAIPVNMAARIMDDLKTEGKVVRGFIGAMLDEVTQENASEYQLPDGIFQGAIIERVLRDGPADKGRLRPGDVITALNGRRITSRAELRNTVAMTRPGSQLNLEVYRGGRPLNISLTVEKLTDEKLSTLAGRVSIPGLGMAIEELTPQIARVIGVEPDAGKVFISQMQSNGAAARMQLRPGDVIIEVNDEEIADVESCAKALNELGRDFRILIQRENELRIIRNSSRR